MDQQAGVWWVWPFHRPQEVLLNGTVATINGHAVGFNRTTNLNLSNKMTSAWPLLCMAHCLRMRKLEREVLQEEKLSPRGLQCTFLLLFSHSRSVYHFALITVGIHDLCYSVYVNYVLCIFFFCTSALKLAQFMVAMMGKALPFKREDLAGLPEGMWMMAVPCVCKQGVSVHWQVNPNKTCTCKTTHGLCLQLSKHFLRF